MPSKISMLSHYLRANHDIINHGRGISSTLVGAKAVNIHKDFSSSVDTALDVTASAILKSKLDEDTP